MVVRVGRLAAAAAVVALVAGPAAAHHGEAGPHPDPRPVRHGGALSAPAHPAAKARAIGARGPERARHEGTRREGAPRR